MITMPSGTVTFLFTDIEGSTRMWEAHPRAMQAALARHDTLLREAIESNGGYVFKTVGDAFCGAFPTAPQALDAALAAQYALRSSSWDATGPIKVRMAVHTGAAEVRDNDYFGLPLNRVARLLSAGYGEQVLLSLASQQLVRDHLPAGTGLKDLGEGGLKDLVKSEHVYQIVAPDLPTDFPPLKSLDTRYIEPSADGVEIPNPYKGLRSFQEADAADFFGREALTQRLLDRLAEQGDLTRFLAVVGPSGSGKSSVVRAGLVPALRQGQGQGNGKLPGSERWLVVELLPGAHPFEELDAVLLSIAAKPPATLMDLLREDERGLVRAVKRVLPRDETIELVLVIDQFEEVFTLVEDEPTRVHFLESLHAAVTDPRGRVRVIVTLRADFFDRPLLYPDPGELMRQRTTVVLPLAADELERAIVRPAQRVGVTLEAELVTTIVKDVGEQPGALPLLQYAMTELFERRVGKLMTLEAYHQSGGVLGALARRADELYEGLNEEEREAARQLFLRLVTLGEGAEDTRRRVRLSELASITGATAGAGNTSVETHGNVSLLDRVLDTFGRYRLLTFDRDPITQGPTVEVAHEALIRTWGQLQEWLDASRANLRVQRQLMAAAAEWESSGRDRSFLAAGARLAQFEALAAEGEAATPGAVALTAEERAYLEASVGERGRQEAAERERQARELVLQKRAANRLRALVGALALFLGVAVVLTAWALTQSQVAAANATRAEENAATARANLAKSEAQRLAAEANNLMQARVNPELAALLSIRSIQTQYAPQGDAALTRAATLEFSRQRFVGHTDTVWAVAFSPDGKRVLTGSADRTVKLWDAQTGQELRTFSGHQSEVWGVAFSPDGKLALSGSQDGTGRLWDVESGQQLHVLSGHKDWVGGFGSGAFSPDGRFALTASGDGTARLWDVQTGKEVRMYSGHKGWVDDAAFSPDGKYIATGGGDGSVMLWDTQSGQLVRTLYVPTQAKVGEHGETHTFESILGLDFSLDGKRVLAGDALGAVRVLDAETGAEVSHLQLTGHTGEIVRVVFSPDRKTIITSSIDKTARLWDLQTGEELRVITGHSDFVFGVTLSPDGRYVLTASRDKTARLWETRPSIAVPLLSGHEDSVDAVAFSPNGKYALTGSADGTAKLWDASTSAEVRTLAAHEGGVRSVAYAPDGKALLTGGLDATAKLWDAQTGKELRTFSGHAEAVQGVALAPDSSMVLTGSEDRTAKLWDAQTGKELRTLSGHTQSVASVTFSPDRRYVLTGSEDRTAKLWDAQTGKELRTFSGHTNAVSSVRFSPDGKYVLTASYDGTAKLWDTATGKELRAFVGHTGAVLSTAFSPDGKIVLTGSADATAGLWDVETGKELRRLSGHADGIQAVAFSSDGKTVLTGSFDSTARMWDVDYHEVIRYLCGRLSQDLTEDERAQYEIKGNEPTCPKP